MRKQAKAKELKTDIGTKEKGLGSLLFTVQRKKIVLKGHLANSNSSSD